MSVQGWSNRRRSLAVVGPLLLVGATSPLLMTSTECPFGILGLALACWSVWTGFVVRRLGRWGLNLAAVLMAFSLGETVLWLKGAARKVVRKQVTVSTIPDKISSDLLGSMPRPDSQQRHSLIFRGTTCIDTLYSFDAHGLRVMPIPESPADPDVVVFFGCSFTFGEGIGDRETLPAQVAACAPELQVLNFAYSGYGPHQMLANLESGRVREICPQAPRVVVFQLIPDQVRRVRGWVAYHRDAPRYVLADGKVRRAGSLDDVWWSPQSWSFLWKSRIFSRLLAPRFVGQADLDLAVAIVRQSADEVARQFPGCEFHVLLWNHPDQELAVPLRRQLQQSGLRIHDVETIIPDLEKKPGPYHIPHDGHPTPETNRLLADHVCREILGGN